MDSPEDSKPAPSTGHHEPLAARMRPRSIDEIAGQKHILGEGKLLRRAIEADRLEKIRSFDREASFVDIGLGGLERGKPPSLG